MLIEVPTAISTLEQDNLVAENSTSSLVLFSEKASKIKTQGGRGGSRGWQCHKTKDNTESCRKNVKGSAIKSPPKRGEFTGNPNH